MNKNLKYLLEDCRFHLIGSRGLNLDNCNDYDFILREEYINDPEISEILLCLRNLDLEKYSKSDLLRNSGLYRGNLGSCLVDVLTYDNDDSFTHVFNAMGNMKSIMNSHVCLKSFIEIKTNRVSLFEHLLKGE